MEQQGDISRRGMSLIWRYIRGEPWTFTISVVGATIFAGAAVGTTVILGKVTDDVIIPAFEPEGIEVGTYNGERLFFVGLERASLVLVFKDEGPGKAPRYLQALPGGIAPGADRLHVTFGGNAKDLPATDPITRAILAAFLAGQGARNVNPINVRSLAQAQGVTVEEKRSAETVTFNEWLHVQVFSGEKKQVSAGGTFFGSPNNPRIVRLFSQPVEIQPEGVLFLMNNKDRPGIVGYIGNLMGKHGVNIANMDLSRTADRTRALTLMEVDSEPPATLIDQLRSTPGILRVLTLEL